MHTAQCLRRPAPRILAVVAPLVASVLISGCDSVGPASPSGDDTSHGWFVFQSSTDYSGSDIYLLRDDGGDTVRLTDDDTWEDGHPCWHPSGSRIVFHSMCPESVGDSDIFVMDCDGSNLLRLTSGPAGAANTSPDWDHTGTRIVFARRDGWTTQEVHVMNSDGSLQVALTDGPGDWRNRSPSWSPDGQRIAYVRSRWDMDDSYHEVWIMDADGSNKRRLTVATPDTSYMSPRWSPDGLLIACSRIDWSDWTNRICVVDPETGGQRVLFVGDAWQMGVGAAWSPDCSKLAFTTDDPTPAWRL